MTSPSPFVDTHWLAAHLSSPDVCIVDGSWHMPNAGRDGREEFDQVHIPGAVFFDLDVIANTTSDLPHMVALPQQFEKMVGELGIRETNTIVVYDSAGLFSAARVWWNFRIMGANNCYVLAGGLPKWLREGRDVNNRTPMPIPRPFCAQFSTNSIASGDELASNMDNVENTIAPKVVDLRPNMRFAGLEGEPRPGLRSGFMPGSINLPFMDLIADGQLRGREDIISRLHAAGIDPGEPLISSCGSGVTAPILNLALAAIGIEAMRVYDGSWAEWGQQNNRPVIGADGNLIASRV